MQILLDTGRYTNAAYAVQIKYVPTWKKWNVSCASETLIWLSFTTKELPIMKKRRDMLFDNAYLAQKKKMISNATEVTMI